MRTAKQIRNVLIVTVVAMAFLALTVSSASAQLTNELGILDLTANGGINPATGNPWQAGDTYRFIFTSSTVTNATSTDIAQYNNFVQNAANTSSLNIGVAQGATWKALASTLTVDARDNTSTEIAVDGTGGPIFLLDSTLVADDYVQLWSSYNRSTINKTEELGSPPNNQPGGSQYGDTWTGMHRNAYPDANYGTHQANGELGSLDGTTQGGLWMANDVTQWIWRWERDNAVATLPMYALSEPLTVQSPVVAGTLIIVR